MKIEAHYLSFLHGNDSRGSFFSFSNGGVVSISESSITKDSTTNPTIYSFLSLTGGSSLVLSYVNVYNLLFSGTSTTLISIVGTCYITVLSCNFSNIRNDGSNGAVISDVGVNTNKTVNMVLNGSSFTTINSSSVNGIVITVRGGSSSSIVVHNCNFTQGIRTNNSGIINGGAIYVATSLVVEIDGSIFSGIENVTSGGGVYVGNSSSVVVIGCTFANITVKLSGGMFNKFVLYIYCRWIMVGW
jgi:hypothetical protein